MDRNSVKVGRGLVCDIDGLEQIIQTIDNLKPTGTSFSEFFYTFSSAIPVSAYKQVADLLLPYFENELKIKEKELEEL